MQVSYRWSGVVKGRIAREVPLPAAGATDANATEATDSAADAAVSSERLKSGCGVNDKRGL